MCWRLLDVKQVHERSVKLVWMLDLTILGVLVAGIQLGDISFIVILLLYFLFLFCTRTTLLYSCARGGGDTRWDFRPRVAISFPFIFSSMDSNHLYCFNHDLIIFYLKSNVPRDPSAKIRYTGGNPGRYTPYPAAENLLSFLPQTRNPFIPLLSSFTFVRCTRTILTRLCARRSRLPADTLGPEWPVSSFYISSMDYCPPLLHLRLNILIT